MSLFVTKDLVIAATDRAQAAAGCCEASLECTGMSGCSPCSPENPDRFARLGDGNCGCDQASLDAFRSALNQDVDLLADVVKEAAQPAPVAESLEAASASRYDQCVTNLDALEGKLERALEELRSRRQVLAERRDTGNED